MERGVRECCCVQSVGSGPTILVVVALLLQLPEDPVVTSGLFSAIVMFLSDRENSPTTKKPSIIK